MVTNGCSSDLKFFKQFYFNMKPRLK